ncbi:MAG: hypothetical protein IH611_02080, partial [Deltaproteobacteria bacterium]|nr:hypothetical protein [Deltaproteobacteria bacterium]
MIEGIATEVREAHPCRQAHGRPESEDGHEPPLLPVQAGAHEAPCLVEDDGGGQHESSPERQLEIGEERFGEFRENQGGIRRQRVGHGPDQPPVDLPGKIVADGGAGREGEQRTDHPAAELLEMLRDGLPDFLRGRIQR